ncbi:transporter substrate-binding domain-containing protein [Acetivibrio straminisolvens]|jgi:polar amino acid transport system substrate-binding protein|uniref:transporter substrate-binding domain-containing protein n=1 Tax=Acetivibrio straminisolvens TaxID=253314 RepID=UPI00223EEF25|nr:transporter substrate-binding domain-containing protein [Acetivibrio straminisolvens]HOV25691.1 transporter substrate-binding domain-containing protein [Pseudobacteroides sp.]
MRKGIVFIFCLIIASILLTACGTVKQESILDKVMREGVVKIGSGNNTPPMNYIDENGNWTGFDLELSAAIAERLGVKLERVVVDNKTRISYLANGTVDMVVSNLSHTRSRDEQIDYVEPPYLWTGKIAYAKKGKFKNLTDLAGKRIAVDQGSNAYIAIQQEIEKVNGAKPEIQTFQSSAECFLALKQDKVDAFTQDSVIIAGVAGKEGVEYEAIGGIYSPGLYGIGVPPNDSKWRDKISFILQDLMRDGTYDKIYDKWFGPDGKFPLQPSAKPVLPKESFGENNLYVWPD